MTGWVEPSEIGLKTPRAVEMTARAKLHLAFALGLMLIFLLVFVPVAVVEIQKREALNHRGASIYAEVVALVVQSGKTGPIYRVEYEYEPKEMGRILGPRPRGVDFLPIPAFPDLHVGQFILIRYDPGNPEYSSVEGGFHERREVGAPYHVYVAAALFGAAALAFLAFHLDAWREERKLLIWGQLTPAVILRERDYLSRFGRRARVTFQFTDAEGRVVQGVATGLPSRGDRSARAIEARRLRLAAPMVLYDPRNSGRHLLCPPEMVQPS